MTTAEAIAECERWFAHLDRSRARAEGLQRLAALARTGPDGQAAAQQRLRQIDSTLTAYNGDKLEAAVKALVQAAKGRAAKLTDENPRRYAKGNWVRYIPGHAHGDMHHKDCEDGVVKRQSDDLQTVFVLYDNAMCTMTTGDEPYIAQCTNVDKLKFMGKRRL